MRRLLSLAMVALLIGMSGAVASATGTPVLPEATPVSGPVVDSYAEVEPVYDAARGQILRTRREDVDLLMAGKTSAKLPCVTAIS